MYNTSNRRYFGMRSNRNQRRLPNMFLALGISVPILLLAISIILVFDTREDVVAEANVINTIEEDFRTINVLTALHDIQPQAALDESMFKLVPKPATSVGHSTIVSFEEIKNTYAKTLIIKDNPVFRQYVTTQKPVDHIRDAIPSGYRAVSIRVDAKSSIEGWAWPGAHVDVVWVTTIRGKRSLVPIVHNAEVLSAERNTNREQKPGAPMPNHVTLLVTNKDAKKVQLASTTGTIILSLRGDKDTKGGGDASIISTDDLQGTSTKTADLEDEYEGELMISGERFGIKKDGTLVPLKTKVNLNRS